MLSHSVFALSIHLMSVDIKKSPTADIVMKATDLQILDLNSLDYRVWEAMLERYTKFQPKPTRSSATTEIARDADVGAHSLSV